MTGACGRAWEVLMLLLAFEGAVLAVLAWIVTRRLAG